MNFFIRDAIKNSGGYQPAGIKVRFIGISLFGIQPFDHIHASVIIRSGHLPVSAPAVPAFHPAAGLDGERRLVRPQPFRRVLLREVEQFVRVSVSTGGYMCVQRVDERDIVVIIRHRQTDEREPVRPDERIDDESSGVLLVYISGLSFTISSSLEFQRPSA